MDYPIKSVKNKDFESFELALKQLRDNLLKEYRYDDHSIVIAMSRKGPKLMEVVFTKEELDKLNVVTEFAIPFIFKKMKQGEKYWIYIVDDAVYFGSTLKNLVKEIREYGTLYGIELRIKAYVAILDKESLSFNELEVKGRNNLREGYGHYFVRQLMSKFRSRHQCMEVEYPTVTFILDRKIDMKVLEKGFGMLYKTIYRIRYEEGEVLNVILPKDESQFNKIRIYGDGNEVRMTFMAPVNLAADMALIADLFDATDDAYKQWWIKVLGFFAEGYSYDKLSDIQRRNTQRSLVVLANYIHSYQYFIINKPTIEDLFGQLGYDIESYIIDDKSIYKLIGISSLADDLTQELLKCDNMNQYEKLEWHSKAISSDCQLYEEYDSPPMEERETLESHNEHMIMNSYTFQEALAAVVFNQNLFVERWSRRGIHAPGRHLWFGYTHDVLMQLLKRYTRLKEDPMESMIHEWLDTRVDMGCVVPHYIVDNVSGQWVRVFRPGENEEIIISHLTRFVIHVYLQIDHYLKLGFVPKGILNQMLVVLHKDFWESLLSKQFCFKLIVENRELFLEEREKSVVSVVDYLERMYVLEVKHDEVTIAPRISDPEFLSNTTLDHNSLCRIDERVKEIMDKYQEMQIKYYYCESFFNYYFHDNEDPVSLLKHSQELAEKITDIILRVKDRLYYEKEKIIDEEMEKELIDCYDDIMDHAVVSGFYLKGIKDYNDYLERIKVDVNLRAQNNFKVMQQIVNIMIGVYMLDDFVDVINYVKNENSVKEMTMPNLAPLRNYVEKFDKLQPEKTRRNPELLYIVSDVLKTIINDQQGN